MAPQVAWQPSLLDQGTVGGDPAFGGVRRLALDERSWVDHVPGWLDGSDALFEQVLAAARWQVREVRMYDRTVPEPRLTAGWGPAVDARTAPVERVQRVALQDDPVPEVAVQEVAVEDVAPGGDGDPATDPSRAPAAVADACSLLSGRYGVTFDSVWVNLYRDGRDSVAWHGDRNARVLRDPLVATITLGQPRRFLLRPAGTTRTAHVLEPGPGDLVVMGGACQHEWEHCVPKTRRMVGARMSVTIRHSRPGASRAA